MALPIGYRCGKPIYGPPRPLLETDIEIPTRISLPALPPALLPDGAPGPSIELLKKYRPRDDSMPLVDVDGVKSGCGLLGKVPREIRDQIYNLLLVYRKIDDKSVDPDEEEREGAPELRFLGAPRNDFGRKLFKTPLPLLNKQIYSEATEVFFSRNTLAFIISEDTPGLCQRCQDPQCSITKSACFPSLRQFALMKHVYLYVTSGESYNRINLFSEPDGNIDANGMVLLQFRFLRSHVAAFVKGFILSGASLITLRVKYHSIYHGELADLFNSPCIATATKRDLTVCIAHDNEAFPFLTERYHDGTMDCRHAFSSPGIEISIFSALEPLIHLRGQAQDLLIASDVPEHYVRLMMQCILGAQYDNDTMKLGAHVDRNLKTIRESYSAIRLRRKELRKVNRFLEDRGFPPVMLSVSVRHT